MALDLKKRREAVLPLAIPINGETLNITYRPKFITPESIRDIGVLTESAQEAAKGADTFSVAKERLHILMDELQDKLIEQVKSWDLVNDGIPVPLTKEGLNEHGVDLQLINIIFNAISQNNEVPDTEKKP